MRPPHLIRCPFAVPWNMLLKYPCDAFLRSAGCAMLQLYESWLILSVPVGEHGGICHDTEARGPVPTKCGTQPLY